MTPDEQRRRGRALERLGLPGPAELGGITVLVVGDAVLDRWIRAEPTRLSREAPVPVLRERECELRPGGAANVALGLAAIGVSVEFCGAVGADRAGREVLERLEAAGVGVDGAIALGGWTTPCKTRVLAAQAHRHPAHVLRLDRDPRRPLGPAERERIGRRLDRGPSAELVLVSDYGYGNVGPELVGPVEARAARGETCVLDPRGTAFAPRGLAALTPNLEDLARSSGVEGGELSAPREQAEAALRWLARIEARQLLATLGRAGMALFDASGELGRIPTAGGDRVVDVSGAGDTAAAWFAVALALGRDALAAMELANTAAGCSVMQPGTAAPEPEAVAELFASAPRAVRPDSAEHAR